MDPDLTTYYYGDMVELTAVPDEGYMFTGWGGDLSGTVNPETLLMDGDKAVTATFTEAPPAQYALTVNIVGNGAVTLNPPGGVYDEGTVVELTASADLPWAFGIWDGDLSGFVNPQTINMDGDKTVTANFFEIPYVTPTSGAPGSQFTIYDPEGRMQQGDLAVFYVEGGDPTYGNPAENVVISSDGKIMTGNVPGGAVRATQHYVSIRPTLNSPSRFSDFSYYVTM